MTGYIYPDSQDFKSFHSCSLVDNIIESLENVDLILGSGSRLYSQDFKSFHSCSLVHNIIESTRKC